MTSWKCFSGFFGFPQSGQIKGPSKLSPLHIFSLENLIPNTASPHTSRSTQEIHTDHDKPPKTESLEGSLCLFHRYSARGTVQTKTFPHRPTVQVLKVFYKKKLHRPSYLLSIGAIHGGRNTILVSSRKLHLPAKSKKVSWVKKKHEKEKIKIKKRNLCVFLCSADSKYLMDKKKSESPSMLQFNVFHF